MGSIYWLNFPPASPSARASSAPAVVTAFFSEHPTIIVADAPSTTALDFLVNYANPATMAIQRIARGFLVRRGAPAPSPSAAPAPVTVHFDLGPFDEVLKLS